MLNVGLVGFGFAGQTFHAPVIRVVPGLRLTAIVQRHGPPDPRYPDVEFVRSVDELLTRTIDLVVIATPNPSHHPIAKQCLLAGRHVVIDKPFTITVAEAEELVHLGAAKRRILSAYQNRRYVGDFVTLRHLLSEGVLGRVAVYESHFDRFRPELRPAAWRERKSTRLNSSHVKISYAVFCLKKKKKKKNKKNKQRKQIKNIITTITY